MNQQQGEQGQQGPQGPQGPPPLSAFQIQAMMAEEALRAKNQQGEAVLNFDQWIDAHGLRNQYNEATLEVQMFVYRNKFLHIAQNELDWNTQRQQLQEGGLLPAPAPQPQGRKRATRRRANRTRQHRRRTNRTRRHR